MPYKLDENHVEEMKKYASQRKDIETSSYISCALCGHQTSTLWDSVKSGDSGTLNCPVCDLPIHFEKRGKKEE